MMPNQQPVTLYIGVDDTGNDGIPVHAENIEQHRVTLCAAICARDGVVPFIGKWLALIEELKLDFEIEEIHTSDIVNQKVKRKPGRSKAVKDRLLDGWRQAIALLVENEFVFVVQTMHAELEAALRRELSVGPGDVARQVAMTLDGTPAGLKRAAWFLLTRKVLDEVRKADPMRQPINVIWSIDRSTDFSGLSNAMRQLSAVGFGTFEPRFEASRDSFMIQAADCAAYTLNRHQMAFGNRLPELAGTNKVDLEILKITRPLVSRFLGLSVAALAKDELHHETYDLLFRRAAER